MELPVVKRLKKDLQELMHELNVKLPKELQEAAAHGDLSENAEYEAAKSRQELVRARIGQIQGRIRELSMYTLSSIPHDVVAYGSRVTVEDDEDGDDDRISHRLSRGGRRRDRRDLAELADRPGAAEPRRRRRGRGADTGRQASAMRSSAW